MIEEKEEDEEEDDDDDEDTSCKVEVEAEGEAVRTGRGSEGRRLRRRLSKLTTLHHTAFTESRRLLSIPHAYSLLSTTRSSLKTCMILCDVGFHYSIWMSWEQ